MQARPDWRAAGGYLVILAVGIVVMTSPEVLIALQQARVAAAPRLPWESGPLAAILGGGPLFMPLQPAVSGVSVAQWLGQGMGEPAVEGSVEVGLTGSSAEGLVLGPEGDAPALEDSKERQRVLDQWAPVVEGMAHASTMVAKALEEGTFKQSLADAFARKATATLRARLSAIRMYLEWCTQRGAQPWPLREETSYRYSSHLRVVRPLPRAPSPL